MPDGHNVTAVHAPGPSATELLEAAARRWVAENPERFAQMCGSALHRDGPGFATSDNPFVADAEQAFHRALGL